MRLRRISIPVMLSLILTAGGGYACPVCKVPCGSASLDKAIGLSVVSATQFDVSSPSPEELASFAEKKGFSARVVKLSADDLASLKCPVLAMLWTGHFVEVEGGAKPVINDPSPLPKPMTFYEFKALFSGVVVAVSKDASLLPKNRLGADIRVIPPVQSFGTVSSGEKVESSFAIKNMGDVPLSILGVRSTCGCTVASVSEKILPPGASTEVRVTFDTANRKGEQKQKIYIQSNDPSTPIAQAMIMGVVRSAKLDIYPRGVDFGDLRTGEAPSREVQIFDSGNADLKIMNAKSDSPYITCQLKDTGTKENPRYSILVKLTDGVPEGEFSAKIKVSTNHPNEPVAEIPVTARRGHGVAIPAPPRAQAPAEKTDSTLQVFFPGVKKGSEAKQSLTLKSVKGEPFGIEGVECTLKWVSIKTEKKSDGREYTITATLSPDAPAGTVRGDAFLRTTDPTLGRVRLRIFAIVAE